MEEIVIARPDRSATAVVAIGVTVLVVAAVNVGGWLAAIWMIPLGLLALSRFSRMKLSVTSDAVVVVNFATRKHLDLSTVEVLDETNAVAWPADDTGERQAPARALYLADDSGERVRVGVAPARGSQLDSIAESLYRAIATMQARP